MSARRTLGRTVLVLVGLVAVLAAYVFVRARTLEARRYEITAAQPVAVPAPPDSAVLARGAHLATVLGCQECHAQDFGGRLMADAPPFRVFTTNLTRGDGGLGSRLTPVALERALRHGVGHDGRGLWAMPTVGYRHLSDADVAAMAAYLATVPPVDRDSSAVTLRPLGRVLLAFGLAAPEVFSEPAPGPAHTPEGADLGAYLARVGCQHCHGADLRGASHPDPAGPTAPSLDAAAGWSAEQFERAMRTGVRPSGPALDAKWMPWPVFRHLTAEELTALRTHLRAHFGKPGA